MGEQFMTTATYIARSSAIASRVLAGETMVMSVADSTFFMLNEVASAIWRAAMSYTPCTKLSRATFAPSLSCRSKKR